MDTNILPYGKISSTKKLGQAVRAKRKADGLTQTKAAALCGVGVRFISDLENGKPTVELGKALSVLGGLGLTIDVRPRGHLVQDKVVSHRIDGSKKTYRNKIPDPSSTHINALGRKLADSYKNSLGLSSKVLDNLSKHRMDYFSLGLSMDKYNDIAKLNKNIIDSSSTAATSLSNIQATIDKLGINKSTIDDAMNGYKMSASVSSDAIANINKLHSTIASLNLDTKVIDSLQDNYKNNLKLSKNAIREISNLKKNINSSDVTKKK